MCIFKHFVKDKVVYTYVGFYLSPPLYFINLWVIFMSELGPEQQGILLCFVLFCFQDRVSLCSPKCPGTHSVDQAGLELTEIHLPLPSKCWN